MMDLPANYNDLQPANRRLIREEYARRQEGNCHHCGKPLSGLPSESVRHMPVTEDLFPPNFFKWPVHLHHCRKTGMTIGAVHNYCNAVLWEYFGE